MSGPPTILVNNFSATHSRPHETEPQNAHPINKTHSDMVKFADKHDNDYRIVLHVLRRLSINAQKAIPRSVSVNQGKDTFLISQGPLLYDLSTFSSEIIISSTITRNHSRPRVILQNMHS